MYSQRQKSRDRSRDREKKYHRSPSPSQQYRKHRHRNQNQSNRTRSKRVKFDQNSDIRVFRKQDQPAAKGLSQEQINKLKSELEKEVARINDFGWEQARHRELMNEKHSRKEQKDKEKLLMERLGAVNESMSFSCPVSISGWNAIIELGCDSEERLGHTLRCYYTSLTQIPDDPQEELLNNNSPTQSKIIKFDHDNYTHNHNYASKKQPEKPLKGILKMPLAPPPEQRPIDPQLILLLKDLKTNPSLYTKQKTELLLKPYKQSGQLQYLTKNKQVLEMMLRNIGAAPNRASVSVSAGRQSQDRNSQNRNQLQYAQNFVPKADKFRTVPCKYYHSPLGCNKIDNCTYIHDQRYKGVPVPPNYTPPASTAPSASSNNYSPGMYPNSNTYVNRQPSAPAPMSHGNYMMPPAYGNHGYYPNGNPGAAGYSSGGSTGYSNNFSGSNSGNSSNNYAPMKPDNYSGNQSYQGGNYGNTANYGSSGNYGGSSGSYGSNGGPPPGYQNYYMGYGGYYGNQNGSGSGGSKPN